MAIKVSKEEEDCSSRNKKPRQSEQPIETEEGKEEVTKFLHQCDEPCNTERFLQ